MNNVRTDLAIELLQNRVHEQIGITKQEEIFDYDIKVTTVKILNEIGERSIGKKIGSYITVEAGVIAERDLDVQKQTAKIISDKLKKMIDETMTIDKDKPVLVVGLGNRGMTADALGSKTCDKIIVTRHVYDIVSKELDTRLGCVAAFAPNVLGVTGIESFDIIKGIVNKIAPQLLIVVDSLASQKTSRIATTFQLSNTGIVPGSGVGNHRSELSKETLNIPVISIGVPLVVYAETIVTDVMGENAVGNPNMNFDIKAVITDVLGDLVVTPKNIDEIVSDDSFILSLAINLATHRELSIEDIVSYTH